MLLLIIICIIKKEHIHVCTKIIIYIPQYLIISPLHSPRITSVLIWLHVFFSSEQIYHSWVDIRYIHHFQVPDPLPTDPYKFHRQPRSGAVESSIEGLETGDQGDPEPDGGLFQVVG